MRWHLNLGMTIEYHRARLTMADHANLTPEFQVTSRDLAQRYAIDLGSFIDDGEGRINGWMMNANPQIYRALEELWGAIEPRRSMWKLSEIAGLYGGAFVNANGSAVLLGRDLLRSGFRPQHLRVSLARMEGQP